MNWRIRWPIYRVKVVAPAVRSMTEQEWEADRTLLLRRNRRLREAAERKVAALNSKASVDQGPFT